jgi:hypothetical protein
MRTTIRLDDDLLGQLKQRAQAEKLSLTRCINRLLRRALEAPERKRARPTFRQETFRMGAPSIDLNKALSVATELDDEEVLRKLALRK